MNPENPERTKSNRSINHIQFRNTKLYLRFNPKSTSRFPKKPNLNTLSEQPTSASRFRPRISAGQQPGLTNPPPHSIRHNRISRQPFDAGDARKFQNSFCSNNLAVWGPTSFGVMIAGPPLVWRNPANSIRLAGVTLMSTVHPRRARQRLATIILTCP